MTSRFTSRFPRDRLGRIKVSFLFTPTPVGQEAAELLAADTTGDGRILMDDFSEEQITSYTDGKEAWGREGIEVRGGRIRRSVPGNGG